MQAICDKCGKEVKIEEGHLGKRHKSCNGRKQDGSSRRDCGIWTKKVDKPIQEKEGEIK